VLEGHGDSVTALAAWEEGGLVASGSLDGCVRLWSIDDWLVRAPRARLRARAVRVRAQALEALRAGACAPSEARASLCRPRAPARARCSPDNPPPPQ
jgi:hypothetical protein